MKKNLPSILEAMALTAGLAFIPGCPEDEEEGDTMNQPTGHDSEHDHTSTGGCPGTGTTAGCPSNTTSAGCPATGSGTAGCPATGSGTAGCPATGSGTAGG